MRRQVGSCRMGTEVRPGHFIEVREDAGVCGRVHAIQAYALSSFECCVGFCQSVAYILIFGSHVRIPEAFRMMHCPKQTIRASTLVAIRFSGSPKPLCDPSPASP